MRTKFLIIRFSSIGDIVLTTPVIRCLKEQVTDSEIHYLTKRSFSAVLSGNPNIDKIHFLKEDFRETIEELKAERLDYIIDLHHNLRSLRVKSKLKLLSFSFNKINFEKWLIVHFKIDRLPDVHIVDRYISTLELFDAKYDGKGLDYFIPQVDEINLSDLPVLFQNGYVGFVIGAKHETKKLPENKIIELCRMLNVPVLLLGGPEDRENGDKISQQGGDHVFNTCGKFNLNQSASLVKQARVIVTHDTGLMHIASAFHKKIISVWGNTIPSFGMYPFHPHPDSKIYQVHGLSCRPCSKIGYSKCPKKHFKCMNDQDISAIAERIRTIYASV